MSFALGVTQTVFIFFFIWTDTSFSCKKHYTALSISYTSLLYLYHTPHCPYFFQFGLSVLGSALMDVISQNNTIFFFSSKAQKS